MHMCINIMNHFTFSQLFYVILIVSTLNCNAQEPVGCGGYLKPSHPTLYRQVSINLLSPDGALRYTTDVNPNGAYSIPVYDYGDYIIQVEPPVGWSFEPSEGHRISVRGRDSCAQDFNFNFSGFALRGTVVTKGLSSGPSDVRVDLLDPKTNSQVGESVTTQENGMFEFKKVMPGNYKVVAQNDKLKFEVKEASVYIKDDGSGNADGLLKVQGYSVSGLVTSEGQPIKGVFFFLYSKQKGIKLPKSCATSSVSGFKQVHGAPLCHVTSNAKGEFFFDILAGGEYQLVPFFRGQAGLVFEVEPAIHTFSVEHSDVKLGPIFQVAGFAISGRVLAEKKRKGVAGISVKVDGKQKHTVLTGRDGVFTIASIRSGSYVFTADAESQGMRFEPMKVDISPQKPTLQDLVASSFSVCGKIVVERNSRSGGKSRQLAIENKDHSSILETISTDETGQFCVYLKPGHYHVRPLTTPEEDENGMRLAPVHQEVKVVSSPIYGLRFSQFRAKISGKIQCLESCENTNMRVILEPEMRAAEITPTSGNMMQFSLTDVMPGTYTLKLEESTWCWKTTELKIDIVDKDIDNLVYKQEGYKLTVVSSHEAQLTYDLIKKSSKDKAVTNNMKLEQKSQTMCLPQSGKYTLKATSCHKLEQNQWTYDTTIPEAISVAASQHKISIQVKLDSSINDVKLNLEYEDTAMAAQNRQIGPLNLDKQHMSVVSLWEPVGTVINITALSNEALFLPNSVKISVAGLECDPVVAKLTGQKGVFVNGRISPALADVDITLTAKKGDLKTGDLDIPIPDGALSMRTDSKGDYQFGPLSRRGEYTVFAEKAGYKFTLGKNKRDFVAHKLAEVGVEVVDQDGKPLVGVLLSVSGDDFRANQLTDDDGKRAFLGLAPGTYYIRAAMKEYKFEPASASIKVEEGRAVFVKVKGKRMAYTASGIVTALNGDPEAGVMLEAVADEKCRKHTETAFADEKGQFRLRGLQPGCAYSLALRSGDKANVLIERTAPSKIFVESMPKGDLPGLHFYAFRRVNLLQLSASVDVAEEHQSSLKVQIFPESAPNNVILSQSLGKSRVLFTNSVPVDPAGKKKYVIRLESSLSNHLWKNQQPQEHVFVASPGSSGALHIDMKFQPVRRHADQELPVSSFLMLPLVMLVLAAIYHRHALHPYVEPVLHSIKDTFMRLLGYGGGGSGFGFGLSDGGSGSSGSRQPDPNDFSDIPTELLRPSAPSSSGQTTGAANYRGKSGSKAKPRKT